MGRSLPWMRVSLPWMRVCVNHQSASKAITAYKEFPGRSPYALAWALNPTATRTTR